MNIRILLGTGLLLTVGTAVAGTLIYGQSIPASAAQAQHIVVTSSADLSPEVIAMLAATANDDSDDYIAPKVPI